MAPKKSQIIRPNRCGMYDYDDEYEEMLRSSIETFKRNSEYFREQEEFHRRRAEEVTDKAIETEKKLKEIDEARAELGDYVFDFTSPTLFRKKNAEELARDKMISAGNETDLAGANVTMAAQKKIMQEQEGELACDKMISTRNEKDLAGANVTTKAATIKQEEVVQTCGLMTFTKEESAE